MTEAGFEKKVVKTVKEYGGLALKLNANNFVGVPDRLVLLPSTSLGQPALAIFVELKAAKGVLSAVQMHRLNQLSALGFQCYVISEIEHLFHILYLNKRELKKIHEKKYMKYLHNKKDGYIFVSEIKQYEKIT